MKKLILVAIISTIATFETNAQEYATHSGHITFFSKGTVTDVNATDTKVFSTLNIKTRELTFHMSMADFQFENKKMGRDAEEKYLETEKFKTADFKGKIIGDVDFDKPGTYHVVTNGKLTIHGVERQVSENGTIVVGQNQFKITSEFKVQMKDFAIETPSMLGKEMTDDQVTIKVDATLAGKHVASKK